LRTGTSVWDAISSTNIKKNKKPSKKFYDLVIIGCGITGSLAAEKLSHLGLEILAIDRREPASGSTSASTALIQWEIDQPLTTLAKKRGWRAASAAYLASAAAVKSLERRINQLKLRCEMVPRDTLLIAGTVMGKTELQKEVKNRVKLGLPSKYLDRRQLLKKYGFDREGAIESKGSLELNPKKLSIAFLAEALDHGIELVFPVNVTKMEASELGVLLKLDTSDVIAASKVIVATGYEILPEIPTPKYDLSSTWALCTVKQRDDQLWPYKALVWEASDPYLYFRTTTDNRIIVGGEDAAYVDPTQRDRAILKKAARILKKFGVLWPAAALKAEYRWAGTFADSPTGLPVIGPLPNNPNVFCILGAGGNGITFSVIAADLAYAWVKQRKHKLQGLFSSLS
jgi:glycine/D-amino acid oxidase-like deaminating enzyme